MFGLGFGFAGPAFFWTWPVVFIGQFMVALNFAELAARYPISGAIYQWSRRMGGEIVGWFAGWFMILAQIVTASAAAIALQVVLPNVWSGFQIIGEDSALTSSSGAANAVLLATGVYAARELEIPGTGSDGVVGWNCGTTAAATACSARRRWRRR